MPNLSIDRVFTLVAATDVEISPESPQRQYALVVNDGISDAYLGFGKPGVVNGSPRLNNGGGNYEINSTNRWHGSLHVISSGTPVITITEW